MASPVALPTDQPPGPPSAACGRTGDEAAVFLVPEGAATLFLVLLGLAGVGLTALVDRWTGPQLNFALFYLVPVGAATWRGGFAVGILLSLAAIIAWHAVEDQEALLAAALPPINLVLRFCFFVTLVQMVSRHRAAMLRQRALARTDALTGVANARTFYEQAHREIQRSARASRPLTVVYLDLDNFKEVNDRLGHQAGDALLRRVAETIERNTRASDLTARLGGDEFALLLPETDAAGAAALLHNLRNTLLREISGKGWPITYSIGAATFLRMPPDVDAMVRRVDALMYGVKQTGKDRVQHEVVYDPQSPPQTPGPEGERRATVRILCNRPAKVQILGVAEGEDWFATVRDVSNHGLGLLLDRRLADETVLAVELRSGNRVETRLARVVRSRRQEGGWLHGCQLSHWLSPKDLQDWLS